MQSAGCDVSRQCALNSRQKPKNGVNVTSSLAGRDKCACHPHRRKNYADIVDVIDCRAGFRFPCILSFGGACESNRRPQSGDPVRASGAVWRRRRRLRAPSSLLPALLALGMSLRRMPLLSRLIKKQLSRSASRGPALRTAGLGAFPDSVCERSGPRVFSRAKASRRARPPSAFQPIAPR